MYTFITSNLIWTIKLLVDVWHIPYSTCKSCTRFSTLLSAASEKINSLDRHLYCEIQTSPDQ